MSERLKKIRDRHSFLMGAVSAVDIWAVLTSDEPGAMPKRKTAQEVLAEDMQQLYRDSKQLVSL